jgi:hypothetical protein
MDGEGGGWNQPAAVSWGGNGVITIEKSQGHVQKPREIINPDAGEKERGDMQQPMHLDARPKIHDSPTECVT